MDGPLEAVFSEGGRPSRGARGPLRGPMCVAFLFVASPSAVSAARAPCSIVLAVNRDEFFARSTRECHWWDDHPQIFAGRDAEAGGTWLGLTRDGRVAVLTNFTERDKIPDAPSRGELPVGYLTVRHQPPSPRRAEPPPGAHPNDPSAPRGHTSRSPSSSPRRAGPRSSYPRGVPRRPRPTPRRIQRV